MELTMHTPAEIQEPYSSRNHHSQEVRPSRQIKVQYVYHKIYHLVLREIHLIYIYIYISKDFCNVLTATILFRKLAAAQ